VSVLKGEGRVVILYGTTSVPSGPRTYSGYLARPDLTGEWPTILLVPSSWGITSSVKDVCRRLARHGFAVLAPDLYRGAGPTRGVGQEEASALMATISDDRAWGDLEAFIEYLVNPAGFWSSAERGFGLLGMGLGGRWATLAGERSSFASALGLVGPALVSGSQELDPVDRRPVLDIPVLGLSGRDDPSAPPAAVAAFREDVPSAEWVIYDGAGADYWDDYLRSYDGEIAADTLERLIDFFAQHLPESP
jgi:carboxymethylenebutenolidase